MTRKFKHKQTDWVAVEEEFNVAYKLYNAHNEYQGRISFRMVESGSDWQEITQEPILVTEDGYEVYEKPNSIWVVDKGYALRLLSWPQLDDENKKYFCSKANAQAHIESYKPRYNIKDLMFLRQEVKNAFSWYWTEQEIKDAILKTIIDLKNSKND